MPTTTFISAINLFAVFYGFSERIKYGMRAGEGSCVQYAALDIFSFCQKTRDREKKGISYFSFGNPLLAEDVIQSAKWEENSGGLQVWPASQESVRSSEMTPLQWQWA